MADLAVKLGNTISESLSKSLAGISAGMKGTMSGAVGFMPMASAFEKGFSKLERQSKESNKTEKRRDAETKRKDAFVEESANEQKKYDETLLGFTKGMALNIELIQKDVAKILELMTDKFDWSKLLASLALLKGLVPKGLGDALAKIGDFVKRIPDFFKSIPGKIGSFFDDLIKFFQKIKLPKLGTLLGGWIDNLKKLFKLDELGKLLKFDKIGDGIRSFIRLFGEGLDFVRNLLRTGFGDLRGKLVTAIGDAIKVFSESNLGKAFGMILDDIRTGFRAVLTPIKNLGASIADDIAKIRDSFKLPGTTKVGEVAKVGDVADVVGDVAKIEKAVGDAASVLGKFGLFGGVLSKIGALGVGISGLITGPLKFLADVTDVVPFVKGIAKVLGPIGVIFSIFDGVANAVDTKKLEKLFGEGNVGIQERISAFIGGFIGGFGGLFDFFANLMGFEGTDFQKSWTENITVSFNKVLDVVKGIFTFMGDIIRSDAFKSIQKSFGEAAGSIFGGFSQLFNFISDVFTSETAKAIYARIGEFLSKSLTGFFNTVKNVVDLVVGIFQLDFKAVKKAGINILDSVVSGIKGSFEVLGDVLALAFKDQINWLIEKVAGVLDYINLGDSLRSMKIGQTAGGGRGFAAGATAEDWANFKIDSQETRFKEQQQATERMSGVTPSDVAGDVYASSHPIIEHLDVSRLANTSENENIESAQRAQTETYRKVEKEKADRLKGYEDERKRLQQQFDSQMQSIFRPMVDALSGPAGTYGPEASVNAGTALARTLSKDFERVGVSVFGKAYGAAIGNTFQQLAGVYMNEFITETLAPSLGMDAKYLNRSINTYMRGIEVVKPQLEQVNKSLNESTKRLEEFEKKKGKVTDAEIVAAAGKGGFTSDQLSRISEYNALKKDVEEKKKQKALIKEQERQYKQAALGDLIYGMTGIATTPRNMLDAYQGGPEGLTRDLASFFGAPFDPLFNPKKAQYAFSAKDAVKMQELEKRIAADKANQAAIDQANKTNQEAMARVNQDHVQGQTTVSKDHIQAQQSTNTSFLGGLTDVFNAAVAGISSAVSGIGSTISGAVDSAKTALGFGEKYNIYDMGIPPEIEKAYDIYGDMTGAISYGVSDANKTYPFAGGEWDVFPPIPVKSRYDGVPTILPAEKYNIYEGMADAVTQGVTEAIKITPKTTILPGGGTQIKTPEGQVVTQSVTGGRVSVADGRVSLTRQTAADQARNERLLGVGSNLASTAIVNALTGGRASKSPIGGMASNVAGDFIKSLVSGKGFNLSGSIGKQFGLGDISSWGQLFSSSASALPTKIGGMFSNAAMSSWMPNFARQGVMDFGSGFTAAGQGWEGISGAFQSGNMSHMLGTGAGVLGNVLQGYQYGQMAKNLIGGDYSMGKGMTTVGKVGTAVASAIWGPVGGAIAGAVDGLLSRAFGRKPKEIAATGFRGTISGTGENSLEKYENWFQKGGWFRSDKSGTNVSAMDSELAKAFSDTTKGIGESNKKLLENLDLSTMFGGLDITKFQKSIDIQFTGKETEEERMQIVQKSFDDFSNSMIKQVLPFMDQFTKEGESAAEALQRLGNTFNAVQPSIRALGFIEPRTFFALPPAIVGMSEDYLKLYTANLTEKLAEAFGGAEQMNSAFDQFANMAFTQEERQQIALDNARADLQKSKKSLEEVGITLDESRFTTEEERQGEAKRLFWALKDQMNSGKITAEQFADGLDALNQFLVTGKLADQIAGVKEPEKPLVFTERTRGIGPAAPGELEFGDDLSNVTSDTQLLTNSIDGLSQTTDYTAQTLTGGLSSSSSAVSSSLETSANAVQSSLFTVEDFTSNSIDTMTIAVTDATTAFATAMGATANTTLSMVNTAVGSLVESANNLGVVMDGGSADMGDAAGSVSTSVSEGAISLGLSMMAISENLGILGGITGAAIGVIGAAVVDTQMDAISAQMSAIDAASAAAAAIGGSVSLGADGSVSVTAAETSVGISVASMDAALGAASADAGGQAAADSAAAAAAGVGISDGGGIAGMEGISDAGGGGDGGGGYASGGKFPGNHPMLVGEAGPEIVVPNQGGTVIPTHKIFEALKNSAPYDSMARNAIESFVTNASPTSTVVQNIQATPGSITPAYMAQQEMNRMLQAERDIVTSINSSMVNQTINNVSSPTTSIVSNGSGGSVRSDNPITNAFTRSVARPRMY